MKIKVKLQNFSSYSTIEAISVRFPLTFFFGVSSIRRENLAQFHHQNRSIVLHANLFFSKISCFCLPYFEIEIKS